MAIINAIEIFVDNIVSIMVSLGPIGGFLLVFFEAFFPPLPIGIIVGLNILSFGNVLGFFISYIATILGCMSTFFIFRKFLRNRFENWFNSKNKEHVKKLMGDLSDIRFTTLVIILALPITPSFVFNVAGGLSKISARKFLLSALIAKPVMLLIYAYITVSFVDALKNPIIFVKVFVLIVLTYIVSKVIEKIVKVE